MKKKVGNLEIENRRARFDYFLFDGFEAGIVLTGGEVKSVKEGRASLAGAYARFLDGELFLVNAFINPYQMAEAQGYDPRRSRKLLLHKGQVDSLVGKMSGQGLTLLPVSMYVKKGFVKVGLALGKGKKQWDKRDATREKDLIREEEMILRGKG